MKEDVTYCYHCYCMTHSVRKGHLYYVCGKCGYEKTFGDILQEEKK